ncbi:MAG: molybdopterin synthase [Haloarculaceae archaeon]
MQVIGVVGYSGVGKTTLVERLVERLAERGRVGSIKHLGHEANIDTEGKDTARHRAAGASVTYGVTDDAGWFATGEDRELGETLDRMAAEYDYAVVESFTESSLPHVRLGDRTSGGEVVYEAADAEAVDMDQLVAVVEDLAPYESLESLVAEVKRSPPAEYSGAIATFTGRVRARDGPDEERTTHLEFERYDEVAAERRREITADLESRDGVLEVLLYHRTGVVQAGEDIVHVVVLAGHRAEAFEAVSDGIDRLKEEVPIFKKEVTIEDTVWAHER